MAERKISTRFAVEGEDQYKKSVADINIRLKTLKSELALVQSQYAGQENSMEALTAKGQTLAAMYAAQQEKVQTAQAALQNAAAAQSQYAAQVAESQAKLQAAQQAMDEMDQAADSDAYAQLTEQVAQYQQELSKAEQLQRAAEWGMQNWQQSVNYAQRDLNQLSAEIENNNTALESAQEAADAASASMDEVAESAAEAADAAEDMGEDSGNAVDTMAQALTGAGVVATLDQIKDMLLACAEASSELSQAESVLTNNTNLSGNELERYRLLLRQLYGDNYGESMDDVAQTLATVRQQLDADWPTDQLKTVTEDAITLRDTFGYEVTDSIRAAKALVDNFGVDGDEAFRLIAEGARNGLDYSGELLDTVSEYSVQFKKLGLSANDMFKVMQSGADNGAWNLDKIGDAYKELSIRVVDGSDTTAQGFAAIGLNAEQMAQKFARGGESAKAALQQTTQALAAMDDPVQQNIAGVNLFGTMWEDLGPTVVTQMANITEGTYGAADAMENLRENRLDDLSEASEHLDRNMQLLAATAGDAVVPALADVKNAGADALAVATDWLAQNPQVMQVITALVAGFALLTAGITAYTAATAAASVATKALDAMMKNNPYLLTATVVLSLVAAIGTYVLTAGSASDKTRELNKNLEEIKSTHEQNVSTINATAEAAQGYIDKLAALEAQSSMTAEDQLAYKQTVDELNALMPDLNAKIDEQTGLLIGGAEALRANTEAWQENALAQEMQERYQEVLDGQAEATVNLTEKKLALRDAEAEMNDLYAEMQSVQADLQLAEEGRYEKISDQATAISMLQEQMTELTDKYALARDAVEQQSEAVDEAQGVLDGYTEEIEHVKDIQDELANSSENAAASAGNILDALDNLGDAYEEASGKARESIDEQIGMWDKMDTETEVSVETLKANLRSQITYLKEYSDNLQTLSGRNIEGVDTLVRALSDGSTESAEILRGLVDASEDDIKAVIANLESIENGKKTFTDTVAQLQPEVKTAMDAVVAEADRFDTMYSNGQHTMSGLLQGLKSKLNELDTVSAQISNTVSDAYKKANEIASPSKKMRRYGRYTMEGLALGLVDGQNLVVSTMNAIDHLMTAVFEENTRFELDPDETAAQAEAQMQAYVDEIEEQTEHAKKVMEWAGEDIQKALVDHGYSEDMAKEFVSRYDEMCQQAVEKVKEAQDQMQEQLDALQEQWEEAIKARDEFEKKLSDFGDLYIKDEDRYQLEDLNRQMEQMQHYGEVLSELQKRVPQSLFSEIAGMNLEDAVGYGEQLLALSDEDFEAYVTAWEEKQGLASELAQQFYGEQVRQFEEEYQAKMQEAYTQMQSMAFDNSAEIVRQMVQGLQSERDALEAEARRLQEIMSGAMGWRVSAADVDGSHAGGLAYVPYDGYVAELHKGERVLTAAEARAYIAANTPASIEVAQPTLDSAQVASMVGSALSTILLGTEQGASGDLYLSLAIDGTEFARGILPHFRAAADQSPEIKSDLRIN